MAGYQGMERYTWERAPHFKEAWGDIDRDNLYVLDGVSSGPSFQLMW